MNNSGSNRNLTLSLRLGSTELWNSGASNAINAGSTARRAWHLELLIQALGTVTSQRGSGIFVLNTFDAAGGVGIGAIRLPDTATGPLSSSFLTLQSAVNMAAAQTLQLQAMFSNTGCSMRLEHALIEVS